MRVGMVVRYFSPQGLGAVQRCAYELATRLVRDGEQCTIYTDGGNDRYELEGVEVVQLPSSSFFERSAKLAGGLDVCHFHGSTAGCVRFSRHFRNKPVLTIYDAPPNLRELLNLRMCHLMEGRILSVPSYWLLAAPRRWLSSFLAGRAHTITGMDISWLSTTPPFEEVRMGVDLRGLSTARCDDVRERLGIAPEQRVVLYLGHGYLIRGLDVLIEAHARTQRDVVLVLVLNPNEPYERVVRLATRRLSSERLRIVEQFVPDVACYYRAADVVALPYLYGGELPPYPFVLLEAMACARPVITTPVASIPKLIDGRNGMLVRAGSVEQLVEAIECVLDDEHGAEQMGKRARQSVEGFDWELAYERFVGIYGEVVASG